MYGRSLHCQRFIITIRDEAVTSGFRTEGLVFSIIILNIINLSREPKKWPVHHLKCNGKQIKNMMRGLLKIKLIIG